MNDEKRKDNRAERKRIRKKNCVGCDKQKEILASKVSIEIKEARFNDLVKKYGAMGIMRLGAVYFGLRYKHTGQKVFEELGVLFHNFEDIVRNRIKKLVSEEEFAEIEKSFDFNIKNAGANLEQQEQ